jgi:DNA modification methylase
MEPYYSESGIEIWLGDCKEIIPFLPKPDLVITDPPYVVGAKGCGLAGNRQYLKDITASDLDRGFDLATLSAFPNWFCFCGKQQLPELLQLVKDQTWMLITWNKPNPTPLTNNNYLPDTEYIVHVWETGRLFGNYDDKSRFVVWPVEQNGLPHPTVKPLRIVEKLIRLGSQAGDLVIDPFMGSGTTLLASRRLGRRAIGIEINEGYCELAARRLLGLGNAPNRPALLVCPFYRMITIRPQFFYWHGIRPLTYGLWKDGVFIGYCTCWCRAVKAAEWLELALR